MERDEAAGWASNVRWIVGRCMAFVSGLLCLIFICACLTSEDHPAEHRIQMGAVISISILSAEGRCEITTLSPYNMNLGLLVFHAVYPPGRVPPIVIKPLPVPCWQVGPFVWAGGKAREVTHGSTSRGRWVPAASITGEGFGYRGTTYWTEPIAVHVVGFPYWFSVLVTGILPARRLWRIGVVMWKWDP